MKTLLRKLLGLALMVGVPVTLSSWLLGNIVEQGIFTGFIMLLAGALSILGVLVGFLLLMTIMEIGRKLWKGEKITWQTL